MKKYKISRNIALGALVGFAISLMDRHARKTVRTNLQCFTGNVKDCLKQPVQSIEKTKATVETWKRQFDQQSDQLLNAVEQVENTLEKFRKDS